MKLRWKILITIVLAIAWYLAEQLIFASGTPVLSTDIVASEITVSTITEVNRSANDT